MAISSFVIINTTKKELMLTTNTEKNMVVINKIIKLTKEGDKKGKLKLSFNAELKSKLIINANPEPAIAPKKERISISKIASPKR